MSIVLTETYVVKSESAERFTPLLSEFLAYKREHANLFAGLKSWKLYKQEIGRPGGLYIEMWEFESLAAMEEINARVFGDVVMKGIQEAFHRLVEPATFTSAVWRPVA